MDETWLLCHTCDDVVAFVAPPVEDGYDPDERLCALCGAAVLLARVAVTGWSTLTAVA